MNDKTESGSISMDGYLVEARSSAPIALHGGGWVSDKWRQVQHQEGSGGIPGGLFAKYTRVVHKLTYHQAMALVWDFAARLEASGHYHYELRVRKYKVNVSWSAEPTEDFVFVPSALDANSRDTKEESHGNKQG